MLKSIFNKKLPLILSLSLLICGIFAGFYAPSVQAATTYYVSPQGNDSNNGTESTPFLTLQKAVNSVAAGDKVIVKNGTYAGVEVSKGGTSSNWITIQSENKGGAKIVSPQTLSNHGFYFYPTANYINVLDFDISGGQAGFLIDEGGHDLYFKGNTVHDVGRFCTNTEYGLVGVYMEAATNVTIEGNTFENIGRFSPDENGCQPTNANYKNRDHGVYINGSSSVLVKNNIFIDFNHGWPIQLYSSSSKTSSNVKIFNNTFAFDNPDKFGHIILSGKINTIEIKNNIFYEPRNSALDFFEATISNGSVSNNLVSDVNMSTMNVSGITYTNNKEATDPLLTNPAAADFSLQANSPALNAGLTLNDVTVDFAGTTRPQGTAYDLGALELGTTDPSPTPPQYVPADINEDGAVNIKDYTILAGQFKLRPFTVVRADINGDGVVNLKDYTILVHAFLGT